MNGPLQNVRRRAAVFTAVLFTVGCAALVVPTPDDVKWVANEWPGTTYADLLRGRELYVTHCAGCHTLHRPEQYAPEKWPRLVREMEGAIAKKRSKKRPQYTAQERDLILRFLTAASASVRNGKKAGAPPSAMPGEKMVKEGRP